MKTFIELLERKIDGCDALGGLEREKAVYQSVLKGYKKQLTLTDVSQRTWTVDEIRVELESIDEFKAAKYFFDEYGG
jgi:hypothetical protein